MVTLEDAKIVSRKLVSKCHPKAVILFGSVAREKKGRDLDLLIIKEEDKQSKQESYEEVRKALKEFEPRFEIDYFVASTSLVRRLFLDGSPFLWLIQREGRSLYMKDSFQHWFDQAREDLSNAEYLFEGKRYRAVCFHAQQALEKAMKGLLIQKGWELERTHRIRKLMTYAESMKIKFDIEPETVQLIDSLYRGRYPGEEGLLEIGEPSQAEANQILQAVKSFFVDWKL